MKQAKVFLFLGILFLSGCTPLEVGRTVWGSSTRILDEERVNGISMTYNCKINDCFDSVLSLAGGDANVGVGFHDTGHYDLSNPASAQSSAVNSLQDAKEETSTEEQKPFSVFLKDRRQSHIVVMNVPGNIDTTEVGIFFSYTDKGTQIDISSLSTTAKRTVAQMIFDALDKQYQRIANEDTQ